MRPSSFTNSNLIIFCDRAHARDQKDTLMTFKNLEHRNVDTDTELASQFSDVSKMAAVPAASNLQTCALACFATGHAQRELDTELY